MVRGMRILTAIVFTLGMAAGCGGGGGDASVKDACEHVCDCIEGDSSCVDDCVSSANDADPSQSCINCVDDASCSDITGGTDTCSNECDGSL
jgi:hypothetical protein